MAAVTLILNRIRILEPSCLLRDGFNLALKNAFKFLRVLPSFTAASKILHKKESSSLSARCLAGSDLLPINLFSINCRGYPALLYFALIALISMSKFDAVFLDLCKSPEMVFCLDLFGILESQGTTFSFSFRYTCVVTTPSLFKMIFV